MWTIYTGSGVTPTCAPTDPSRRRAPLSLAARRQTRRFCAVLPARRSDPAAALRLPLTGSVRSPSAVHAASRRWWSSGAGRTLVCGRLAGPSPRPRRLTARSSRRSDPSARAPGPDARHSRVRSGPLRR